MTGTTWQPAATCGEADCSEDDRYQEQEDEDDGIPDASVSLGSTSRDGDVSSLEAASEERVGT